MAVVNSTRAAELIREQTGRPCTRQNLEKHVRANRLPKSTLSLQPIRLDSEMVVDEFVAAVGAYQVESWPRPERAAAPTAHRPMPPPAPPRAPVEEPPEFNVSRARHEFEKANLAELERKQKAGLLLATDQVDRAWAGAVTIARTKMLAVPTRARQRIPHLTLEEVAVLEELIREALEELSGGH
jgi:hypothetical protein